MKSYFFIFFLFSFILASASEAKTYSSLDMLGYCRGALLAIEGKTYPTPDLIEAGICMGLINGTITTIQRLLIEEHVPKTYCSPPANWTSEQGMRIFIKWANDNPDKLHLGAATGVIISHMQAFCGWKK